MTSIHIHRTPLEEKPTGKLRERWCFNCRARTFYREYLFTEKPIYDDEGEQINGYYEPFIAERCDECGGDFSSFGSA